MLKSAHNQKLYCDHLERVIDTGAIDAFSYLVGWASSLRDYECHPDMHGDVPDFRWMQGGTTHFGVHPESALAALLLPEALPAPAEILRARTPQSVPRNQPDAGR